MCKGDIDNSKPTRASLVTEAFANCPDTKVVMSGYSQGSQLVHNAASELDASIMEKVSAVVTFGDPGTFCCGISYNDVLTLTLHLPSPRQQFGRSKHRLEQGSDHMPRWR